MDFELTCGKGANNYGILKIELKKKEIKVIQAGPRSSGGFVQVVLIHGTLSSSESILLQITYCLSSETALLCNPFYNHAPF